MLQHATTSLVPPRGASFLNNRASLNRRQTEGQQWLSSKICSAVSMPPNLQSLHTLWMFTTHSSDMSYSSIPDFCEMPSHATYLPYDVRTQHTIRDIGGGGSKCFLLLGLCAAKVMLWTFNTIRLPQHGPRIAARPQDISSHVNSSTVFVSVWSLARIPALTAVGDVASRMMRSKFPFPALRRFSLMLGTTGDRQLLLGWSHVEETWKASARATVPLRRGRGTRKRRSCVSLSLL